MTSILLQMKESAQNAGQNWGSVFIFSYFYREKPPQLCGGLFLAPRYVHAGKISGWDSFSFFLQVLTHQAGQPFVCLDLLFFPAFQGFFVEVAALEVTGDDAVSGTEEVGEEEEESEDEDDGGAGGDVGPEGDEQSGDGSEGAEGGASPQHGVKGIAEKVDGGGR